MARLVFSAADALLGLVASPFAVAELAFVPFLPLAADDVSWRTSSSTRCMSAGNVVISPDRRSESAWFWIVVGQLLELAFREWRRASWILRGRCANQ
jgi:hypothetical protein